MNDTHKVLAYADDVNLIGDDVRTAACKNIGLTVDRETEYMSRKSSRQMDISNYVQ